MATVSAPIYAFLEFFLPVLSTIFFPSHWPLSHKTIVEAKNSAERGMNPIAVTIISSRKEHWPRPRTEPATPCSNVLYTKDFKPRSSVQSSSLALLKRRKYINMTY